MYKIETGPATTKLPAPRRAARRERAGRGRRGGGGGGPPDDRGAVLGGGAHADGRRAPRRGAQEPTAAVALDAEGWVVWAYALDAPASWDFLPPDAATGASSMVALGVLFSKEWATADDGGATRHWNANSMLAQVSPSGALERQHVHGCTGAPHNYNQLTHELRVDHTSADKRVLTFATKMGTYPATTLRERTSKAVVNRETYDVFLGMQVAAWHRARGEVEIVHDLCDCAAPRSLRVGDEAQAPSSLRRPPALRWDYAAPTTAQWRPAETTYTWIDDLSCSGNATRTALDYHHASSISVGRDGAMYVALRNLNVVFCLGAGGQGLRWTIAATPQLSDYTFERDVDKFYTPHSVVELADGRIAMIDDGNSRPGCNHQSGYAGCWSRAVIYELNGKTKVCKLVWQFADPYGLNGASQTDGLDAQNTTGHNVSAADLSRLSSIASTEDFYRKEVETRDLFNWDGGSINRLENGRLLVAFTSPYSSRTFNPEYSMVAYEVDPQGVAVTSIVVPAGTEQLEKQGAYRFIPWKSALGESASAPFEAGVSE